MTEPTKRCPMCGEEILAVAVKCKHCQSMLKSETALPTTGTLFTPTAPSASAAPLPGSAAEYPSGSNITQPSTTPLRWAIAAGVSAVPALIIAATMNGFMFAHDSGQLARRLGYGFTGDFVQNVVLTITDGRMPWSPVAILLGLLVWVGGAVALGLYLGPVTKATSPTAVAPPPREAGKVVTVANHTKKSLPKNAPCPHCGKLMPYTENDSCHWCNLDFGAGAVKCGRCGKFTEPGATACGSCGRTFAA